MVKQINWSPLAKEELRSLLLSSLQKHGNKEQNNSHKAGKIKTILKENPKC